jgi:hydrogenase expression/formation protein HypE
VAFVAAPDAERVLAAMRATPHGAGACRIGTVDDGRAGRVSVRTPLGATRLVDMPAGELLPRIC